MGIYDQLEQLNKPANSPTPIPRPGERKRARPQTKPAQLTTQVSSTDASVQARKHASTHEGTHGSSQANTVERIRKTVKAIGKEIAYLRLTPEEKRRLAAIVFSYKQRGANTSENVICRIAVNYLLEDYSDQKEASVLARVMDALLA